MNSGQKVAKEMQILNLEGLLKDWRERRTYAAKQAAYYHKRYLWASQEGLETAAAGHKSSRNFFAQLAREDKSRIDAARHLLSQVLSSDMPPAVSNA